MGAKCSTWMSKLGRLLAAFALTAAFAYLLSLLPPLAQDRPRTEELAQTRPADTLVLYVFSNTDAAYLVNLKFFLREGVKPNDGCDYIIVINFQDRKELKMLKKSLPELPPQARYMLHRNECYDWGTFGWVLDKLTSIDQYKYFFFVNSSVRGPYFPPYLRGRVHWSDVYKRKLTDQIKLVGPTISCEGSPLLVDGEPTGWNANPHVQSYAVMTDAEGLQVLRNNGSVFKCYDHFLDTIQFSELGSSRAMLDAGYNLASFMPMHHGVDWRNRTNWDCNMNANPYTMQYGDRHTLAPVSMMFVKVKSGSKGIRPLGWVAHMANQMHRWMINSDSGRHELARNEYTSSAQRFKLQPVLEELANGVNCFDSEYYIENNKDLDLRLDASDANHPWVHYINYGQFQHRLARHKCRVPGTAIVPIAYGEDGLLKWRNSDEVVPAEPEMEQLPLPFSLDELESSCWKSPFETRLSLM